MSDFRFLHQHDSNPRPGDAMRTWYRCATLTPNQIYQIIGSLHLAPLGQFTLDDFQCNTREIPSQKVHDNSEIAIVYSNLGEYDFIFTTTL